MTLKSYISFRKSSSVSKNFLTGVRIILFVPFIYKNVYEYMFNYDFIMFSRSRKTVLLYCNCLGPSTKTKILHPN